MRRTAVTRKAPVALMQAAALLGTVLLAACVGGASPAEPQAGPEELSSAVYVAIGASETAGIGTEDPAREAFPQRLYRRLGRGAVLYSFGLPGETTAAALRDELPQAVAVKPTLATVWLNVDDLAAGVPVGDYEGRLDQLVGALSRAGMVQILVANTPHLDRLPAYYACRPGPPPGVRCPLGSVTLPPADEVDARVQAYNAAIGRVVARHGATLVDLYAAGEVPEQHPEYVGQDGFHPSAAGAAAIADTFAAALPAASPRPR
jgi:lysophospholipase L1-like esterase